MNPFDAASAPADFDSALRARRSGLVAQRTEPCCYPGCIKTRDALVHGPCEISDDGDPGNDCACDFKRNTVSCHDFVSAKQPSPRPVVAALLRDVAAGIRVLRTYGVDITEEQVMERARGIVMGLIGNFRIEEETP